MVIPVKPSRTELMGGVNIDALLDEKLFWSDGGDAEGVMEWKLVAVRLGLSA